MYTIAKITDLMIFCWYVTSIRLDTSKYEHESKENNKSKAYI